ncbi:MAG: Salicola phage CGphi29 [Pseudomonadota bacterium]
MAAIASVNAAQAGAFAAALTTLGSSDTITYSPSRKQLLVLRNPTGSTLTLTIDGDGGTTVPVDGIGSVSVSSGTTIAVPAGESRAVVLSTIRHYLQGVVTLSGASGMIAQLFDL